MSETGVCCVLREVLYCFGAFSTGFCARGLRSAPSLRRGVVGRGLRSRRGASSFSPAAAAASRFSLAVQHAVPEHALSLLQAACEHALHVARPAHRMGLPSRSTRVAPGLHRKDNASSKCRDVKRIVIAFCSGSFPRQHDRPNPEKIPIFSGRASPSALKQWGKRSARNAITSLLLFN